MNKPLLLFAFILIFATPQLSAQSRETPPSRDPSTEVIATMRNIRAASQAGDVRAWSDQVADNCIFVEPTGHLQSKTRHTPALAASGALKITSDLSDMKVQQFGDTAVLTYVEKVTTEVNSNTTRSVVRFAEVYRRKGEGWMLILSTETPVPQRQAIKLDPTMCDDYLGQYEIAPGLIGTVSREGNRLFLRGTGWKQAYELVPFEKDKFFVTEFEITEIIFVRDDQGKVIQQVSRTNGQDMVAKKLK
jgi:ketosteroid isomerase-like protein